MGGVRVRRYERATGRSKVAPNLLHPRGGSGDTGSSSMWSEVTSSCGKALAGQPGPPAAMCPFSAQALRAPEDGGLHWVVLTRRALPAGYLRGLVCSWWGWGGLEDVRGPALSCCLALHRSACSSRISSFGAIGPPRWTPGGLRPSAPPTSRLWPLWVQMSQVSGSEGRVCWLRGGGALRSCVEVRNFCGERELRAGGSGSCGCCPTA